MNVMLFLDKCREVLPPGKELTSAQWVAYREKLSIFTEDQLLRLYDAVLEHCKFFPKIADFYECAKLLGLTEKKLEYRPHTWTPTDCQPCGGSGLIAVFWSQEFEFDGDSKTQILRLHYIQPYHTSGEYHMRKDNDDVRSAYRCSCPVGAVPTLAKGIPRWNQNIPHVLRRDWAA